MKPGFVDVTRPLPAQAQQRFSSYMVLTQRNSVLDTFKGDNCIRKWHLKPGANLFLKLQQLQQTPGKSQKQSKVSPESGM